MTTATTAQARPALPASRGELIDLLTAGDRPNIPPGLAIDLHAKLTGGLDSVFTTSQPPRRRLYAGTHQLAQVAECEGRAVAELTDPFRWDLATVRHGLAVEAIRTWVGHRRATPPATAAAHALDWAAAGGSNHTLADLNRGVFLSQLDPHTRSGLIAALAGALARYDHLVHPSLDTQDIRFTQRVGLVTAHVVLRASIDLVCGRSRPGDTCARKVLVSLTTGPVQPAHLLALERAALYETVNSGSPPRRCAVASLDPTTEHPIEVIDITPDSLHTIAQATIDTVSRYAWLTHHRSQAVLRPGSHCGRCPAHAACAPERFANTDPTP